MKEDKYNLN
jgi:hypothetical protein